MSDPGQTDESNCAVFDDSGNEIFTAAGMLRALIRDGSKLMKHPLEDGASIADHRVFLPIGIQLSFILEPENYIDTFQEIRSAYLSNTPLTIQTRVMSYDNMYIEEMPHDESGEIIDTVAVAVKLEQAIFVDPQYAQLPPEKVAKKSNSSTAKTGQKQSTTAPADKSSAAYDLIFGSGK